MSDTTASLLTNIDIFLSSRRSPTWITVIDVIRLHTVHYLCIWQNVIIFDPCYSNIFTVGSDDGDLPWFYSYQGMSQGSDMLIIILLYHQSLRK